MHSRGSCRSQTWVGNTYPSWRFHAMKHRNVRTFGESNSRIWVPGWVIYYDYVWFINTFKKRLNINWLHILLALMLLPEHGLFVESWLIGTWIILVHSQGAGRAFGCWCMGFCRSIVDAPCLCLKTRMNKDGEGHETEAARNSMREYNTSNAWRRRTHCEWSNSQYWEVWKKHNILIAIYRCVDTPNVLWCFFFASTGRPPSFLVKVSMPSGVAPSTSRPCSRQVSDSSSAVPRPPRFGTVGKSSLGMTWGV